MPPIRVKRSSVAGRVPTLLEGELAANLADGKLFIGRQGTPLEFYAGPKAVSVPLAGLPIPMPPGVSDFVVPNMVSATAAGTLALGANTAYWFPFVVTHALTITGIAINVTTAAAGSVTVGIYASNSALQPEARLYLSAGMNTGTAGVKQLSVSWALQPGIYWLALHSTGTATVRALAVGGARGFALPALGANVTTHWRSTLTALPDVAPTSGYSAFNNTAVPAVGFLYTLE